MSQYLCRIAAICGTIFVLGTLWPAPAQADGIGVARFLAHNKLQPRSGPSWVGRGIVKLKEYRHARRDVKRLRVESPKLDRAFDAAFKKTFNSRFSPERSTIFGFFAAWGKGNRAGRLAVIDQANQAGKPLSPLSLSYLRRHRPAGR